MVILLLAICAAAYAVNRLTILSQIGKGGAFHKKAPPDSVPQEPFSPPKSRSPLRRVFEPEKYTQLPQSE